jgi:hypothetical protein
MFNICSQRIFMFCFKKNGHQMRDLMAGYFYANCYCFVKRDIEVCPSFDLTTNK